MGKGWFTWIEDSQTTRGEDNEVSDGGQSSAGEIASVTATLNMTPHCDHQRNETGHTETLKEGER